MSSNPSYSPAQKAKAVVLLSEQRHLEEHLGDPQRYFTALTRDKVLSREQCEEIRRQRSEELQLQRCLELVSAHERGFDVLVEAMIRQRTHSGLGKELQKKVEEILPKLSRGQGNHQQSAPANSLPSEQQRVLILLEFAYRTEMCLELARSILACPEIDWDSEKALEKVREMGYSVRELGGQQEEEEDSDQSGGEDATENGVPYANDPFTLHPFHGALPPEPPNTLSLGLKGKDSQQNGHVQDFISFSPESDVHPQHGLLPPSQPFDYSSPSTSSRSSISPSPPPPSSHLFTPGARNHEPNDPSGSLDLACGLNYAPVEPQGFELKSGFNTQHVGSTQDLEANSGFNCTPGSTVQDLDPNFGFNNSVPLETQSLGLSTPHNQPGQQQWSAGYHRATRVSQPSFAGHGGSRHAAPKHSTSQPALFASTQHPPSHMHLTPSTPVVPSPASLSLRKTSSATPPPQRSATTPSDLYKQSSLTPPPLRKISAPLAQHKRYGTASHKDTTTTPHKEYGNSCKLSATTPCKEHGKASATTPRKESAYYPSKEPTTTPLQLGPNAAPIPSLLGHPGYQHSPVMEPPASTANTTAPAYGPPQSSIPLPGAGVFSGTSQPANKSPLSNKKLPHASNASPTKGARKLTPPPPSNAQGPRRLTPPPSNAAGSGSSGPSQRHKHARKARPGAAEVPSGSKQTAGRLQLRPDVESEAKGPGVVSMASSPFEDKQAQQIMESQQTTIYLHRGSREEVPFILSMTDGDNLLKYDVKWSAEEGYYINNSVFPNISDLVEHYKTKAISPTDPVKFLIRRDSNKAQRKRNCMLKLDPKPNLCQLQSLPCERGEEIRIIEAIAPNWPDVAIALGFRSNTIKIIEKDCALQCVRGCTTMLIEWVDSYRDVTWERLVNALKTTDHEVLAQQIQRFMPETWTIC